MKNAGHPERGAGSCPSPLARWPYAPSSTASKTTVCRLILRRLIVYRPETDFSGTDLQVSLLHSKGVLKIQVKGRNEAQAGRFVRVGVKKDQILPEDPKYILFVQYDRKAAEPGPYVWLVSSQRYREKARLVHGYWKADLWTLLGAKDKWVGAAAGRRRSRALSRSCCARRGEATRRFKVAGGVP